ncbi:hypothetical protein CHS0354_038031 [Potamilus streckersoni]|uniref:Uncharacterized protein n=1 Tax=Potamilus streckersoni TaxID=2493646 RepID=A0AAE0SRI3_9BIVA|nr:hypothetical protein CHS0354_038031 [Potamilus streckersoni]
MSLRSEEVMYSTSSTATDDSSISTASSSGGRSLFGRDERGTKLLTVSEKSKVQKRQEAKEDVRHHPSRLVVFVKWFSSILIGLLFLSCLVLSKFTIVALSNTLNKNATGYTEVNCFGESMDNPRVVFMILLLLLIPNVINFIRGIWLAFFRSDLPWPGKKALLMGLLIGISESFGLCIIVFEVFRMCTVPALSVLISNCVFIFPVLYYLWLCFKSKWKRENRDDLNSTLLFSMLAFLMLLAGLILTMFLVVDNRQPSYKIAEDIWYLSVAIFCVSLSWIPGIYKQILEINDTSQPNSVRLEGLLNDETQCLLGSSNTTGYGSGSLGNFGDHGNSSQTDVEAESHVQMRTSASKAPNRETNTAWKFTIWLSFVKILSISIIGPTIFAVKYKYTTDCWWFFFKQAWNWGSTETDVYFFLANAASSLVGYLLAFLACTTCMQKIAFAIPLFLATPVTFVLLYFETTCELIPHRATYDNMCPTISDTSFLVPAIICLTLAQIFSAGWVVFRSETIVMQKEDMLFWIPSYNGVLLEQWLFQDRRNKHTDVYHEDLREKAKRTKVYICTTMYREA